MIIESERTAINLWEVRTIPADDILLISSDLQARARAQGTARHLGLRLATGPADEPFTSIPARPPRLLILDLDELGPDLDRWLEDARRSGVIPPRVIGFFSHVHEDTGRRAREAGVEAYPRSRFWRELTPLVSALVAPEDGR